MQEIFYWSAKELAGAIRTREISSLEVVEAHLHRIEAVNPRLNAVVQVAENARRQAREADAALARGRLMGKLHGVPVTIKDSLAAASLITTAGTPGLSNFRPGRDATAVKRLRGEGAIVLGKTNCTELCGSGETDNQVYGRTSNPYDLTRSPGGSSGGEVAIIAAGGSPLGLGSDFGGSIRGPSHFCGIVGLNPTMGRVPRTGHIPPYGGAFDTARIGPMARFVDDLALALQIIAGPDGVDSSVIHMPLGDPSRVELETLQVAYYTHNGIFKVTDETTSAVVRATTMLSDEAGAMVRKACPACLGETMEIGDGLQGAMNGIDQRGLSSELAGLTNADPTALDQYAGRWLRHIREAQPGNTMSAAEFLYWAMRWDHYRRTMLLFLKEYDAIVCPVDAYPAQPHGFTRRADFDPAGLTSYTKPYSLAGLPSVVVRHGTSPEGLPIGVQVVARPWREDVALALAQRIERGDRGGWQPPLL